MTPAAATAIIERNGQTVTLTSRTAGAYNPSTGQASVSTATQTVKGVILPFGRGLRNMEGSSVNSDDRQCLVAPLNTSGASLTAPKPNDEVTDAGGTKWTVSEVTPFNHDGTVRLYDLTIRGAA